MRSALLVYAHTIHHFLPVRGYKTVHGAPPESGRFAHDCHLLPSISQQVQPGLETFRLDRHVWVLTSTTDACTLSECPNFRRPCTTRRSPTSLLQEFAQTTILCCRHTPRAAFMQGTQPSLQIADLRRGVS